MTSLLGPAEIRALAAELGVTPTKTLGQNFVHDHDGQAGWFTVLEGALGVQEYDREKRLSVA